jgi:hypothetical protein
MHTARRHISRFYEGVEARLARAHALAAIEWQMRQKLKPILFAYARDSFVAGATYAGSRRITRKESSGRMPLPTRLGVLRYSPMILINTRLRRPPSNSP